MGQVVTVPGRMAPAPRQKMKGVESVNYNLLPEHMRDAMRLYIEHRVPPGGFLTAVLCNDLMEACGRADHINLERLPDFCRFLYNEAPHNCHGSPAKVKAWLREGEGEE